jgi:uncharacterized protein (TIGR00106 family)
LDATSAQCCSVSEEVPPILASFSIAPVGAGEELSQYVAEIIDIVDKSGFTYKLGAMQTTVEGSESEVMALIPQCHRHMRKKAKRVLTHITIDDREGASGRLSGKVADVEKKPGCKVSHEGLTPNALVDGGEAAQ